MKQVKSTADKITDAQERAELAMTQLLECVELYPEAQTAGGRAMRRRDVLRAARRYGRAMDRLTTVRR